ncbi:MAG: CHAT domain-containing protein [Desertifilum sp. SIO1I2]|nr:CHAT domain-containing protein [Desertifilum sp. SIO1I2]
MTDKPVILWFRQDLRLQDNPALTAAAIAAFQQALQVYTREAFPKDWAMIQNNLANAYSERIRGDRAENLELTMALYQNALQLYTREAFPKDWAMIQNNLANVYSERIRGDRAENLELAIAFYQNALQVRTRKAFPKDWAGTQHNLALTYSKRIRGDRAQNLEEAIAFYQQVLQEVYTREAFPEQWALTQNNLANAYRDRIRGDRAQNLEEAIAFYQQVLQEVFTREAFPEDWAMTQINLANAYRNPIRGDRAENLELAIAFYQQVLQEVYTREAFPEQWALTQNNLANAYRDRIQGERAENLEQAIAAYQLALQVSTREAFPEQWALTQNNLANAYSDRIRGERAENLEQAIQCYRQALEIYTPSNFPLNCLTTARNLGHLFFDQKRWQESITTYKTAIEAVELSRSWATTDQRRAEILENARDVYGNITLACIELQDYAQALEYVERSKARNLVELLATRDLYPKGDIPPHVLEELDRLRRDIETEQQRQALQQSQNNLSQNSTLDSLSARQAPSRLPALQQQLTELIDRDITPIDPEFRLTQTVEPITYSEIKQLLSAPDTAIIEWYITAEKILAFIITPPTDLDPEGKITIWQSTPEERQKFLDWAIAYLSDYNFNKPHWRKQLAPRLQELANLLHISEILPKNCRRLVLIPHWFLHLFPLHALPFSSPGEETSTKSTCLLDHFPDGIQYAPSCQLLQQAQQRKREQFDRLIAIQNPTQNLSFTDLEVDAIEQLFSPPRNVLKHELATKAALSQDSSNSLASGHCAHFSCHGYFNFQNPLLSALLLANCYITPAPPEPEPLRHLPLADGQTIDLAECLTLADIFSLDLRQCRLVTLSACETGFTDFKASSEYIGLPSGFLVAGTPSIVSSLWAVNDLSTAVLMIQFYKNVKAGQPVAIALQQAQLWLRDATKEQIQTWIEGLPLNPARRMQFKLWLSKIEASTQPFASLEYWAAFCAIGL